MIKKFKEKAPSVIEKMKLDKLAAEAKLKSIDDERRSKHAGSGRQMGVIDMLNGSLGPKMIREANREDKILERKKLTKDQMEEYFKRTYTKPNKDMPLPTYLLPFTPQEEDEEEGKLT